MHSQGGALCFLSRHRDVSSSFSFGVLFFEAISKFEEKCGLWRIFNINCKYFILENLYTYQARIHMKKSAGNAP